MNEHETFFLAIAGMAAVSIALSAVIIILIVSHRRVKEEKDRAIVRHIREKCQMEIDLDHERKEKETLEKLLKSKLEKT
jgi:biopolymer transport protein ExbB/TolQ